MKKKVLVTYSVKYIKEVELEVTENQNKWLERGVVNPDTSIFEQIHNSNEEVLLNLPIPTFENLHNGWSEETEYIEGSFDIESFEI